MRPRRKGVLVATTDTKNNFKKILAEKNFLLYLQSNSNPKTRHYITMFGKKEYIPDNKIDLYKQGHFEIHTELVNN